jgi:hypothetical protein
MLGVKSLSENRYGIFYGTLSGLDSGGEPATLFCRSGILLNHICTFPL